MEIWKKIKDYPDYEVSNLGNVKSLKFNKERILKASKDSDGYLLVTLCKKGTQKSFTVHQLVAMAFLNHIKNGSNGLVVDHINNVRTDNNITNIQLLTQRENASKRIKKYSSKYTGVSWWARDSNWKSQIRINGKVKFLGLFNCEIEASKAYQEALKKI
jgi:hypothetical protein|tara:strand:+ start:159 stop:635 length:477 start_codon:yes stop_codon:yes gene_type:complete